MQSEAKATTLGWVVTSEYGQNIVCTMLNINFDKGFVRVNTFKACNILTNGMQNSARTYNRDVGQCEGGEGV